MLWIGLTGPMGSGKSTVSALLRKLGYPVLDADQIVHQLLVPGGKAEVEILKTFGDNLRGANGILDRRALGRVVFGDTAKLDRLEEILHPLVKAEVAVQKKNLQSNGYQAAFYDVPLLFEKKMEGQFDQIVVVSAKEELRKLRLKNRSNLSDEEFFERSNRQLSPELKERLASFVIQNQGDINALEKEIQSCLKALKIPLPPVA